MNILYMFVEAGLHEMPVAVKEHSTTEVHVVILKCKLTVPPCLNCNIDVTELGVWLPDIATKP